MSAAQGAGQGRRYKLVEWPALDSRWGHPSLLGTFLIEAKPHIPAKPSVPSKPRQSVTPMTFRVVEKDTITWGKSADGKTRGLWTWSQAL